MHGSVENVHSQLLIIANFVYDYWLFASTIEYSDEILFLDVINL